MDLGSNQINGILPDGLFNMKALEGLVLDSNRIYGTVPSTKLSQLRHLEVLNVLGNNLVGEIPNVFNNLTRLREVYLNNNGFTGTVPDTFGYLEKLNYLSMEGNLFQSGTTVPIEVCSLVSTGNLIHLSADCSIHCTCCTECH